MKKNMGKTDTRMRVIAAFIILMLLFFELVSGTLAIILIAAAAILLIPVCSATVLYMHCLAFLPEETVNNKY